MLKKKMTIVGLNNDSKHLADLKEIELPRNNYFGNSKRHEEFYCRKHMRARLNQICKDEILSDIIMTGTDLLIMKIGLTKNVCHDKTCTEMPKYKYVRIDIY